MKSVLIIITKLSEKTINGDLLKYLAKTANDAEPGIRTNTTICLGKIAKQLNKTVRRRILDTFSENAESARAVAIEDSDRRFHAITARPIRPCS